MVSKQRPGTRARKPKRARATPRKSSKRTSRREKTSKPTPARRKPVTKTKPTKPQKGRPKNKRVWKLLGGLGAFVVAVVLIGLGLNRFATQRGPENAQVTTLALPEGLNEREAAELLAQVGLTDSPWLLASYFVATRASDCFQAGPHLLPRAATGRQLRSLLCRTDERGMAKVIIPEGFTRFDVARRLERKGVVGAAAFLRATERRVVLAEFGIDAGSLPEAESAEGYLFPATYDVPLNSQPGRVVRRFLTESTKRWWRIASAHEQSQAELKREFGFGRHDIVTLASMVEKEAVMDDERVQIASVFLNRLRDPSFQPKYLQSDPTAAYGCRVMPTRLASCRDFDGKVTRAINRDRNNRYSTYSYEGLPPGPIANPGEASLQAVLAAKPTSMRYFVAKGAGRHAFSATYEQHLKAVSRWRQLRKGR